MANTKPSDAFLGITSENDLVFIQSITGSNVSSVDITGLADSSVYSSYHLELQGSVHSAAANLEVVPGHGSTTWVTSGYYGAAYAQHAGTTQTPAWNNATEIQFDGSQGVNNTVIWHSFIDVTTLRSDRVFIQFQSVVYKNATSNSCTVSGNGYTAGIGANEMTGIRLNCSAGNITIDEGYIWGRVNA